MKRGTWKMKGRTTIFLLSLGLTTWVLAAAYDYLTIPTQSFLDWLIYNIPTNELILRTITLGAFAFASLVLGVSSLAQESAIERLGRSNEKYTSLLRNLPVGIYRMTSNGGILEANRQFAQMLGYQDVNELKSVNLNEAYINKPDRQRHLESLKESPVFAEFELRRKDGATVWVRDYPRATLNADGSIAHIDGVCVEMHGIEGIMRDLTEHKKLESMKDHFIVSVTHELRTPLVSIKGYVDHIIAKEPDLTENLRSKIEAVRRNADRLLELTDDLLNIQDVETGHLEFKLGKLVLQEVLNQCLEEIQPLLKEKHQEVRLEIPGRKLEVFADRLRLNQVLMNLLSNANKFTPDDGTLTLRIEEDDGTATVSVTDTGIGLDKKDLERVFEPFAVIEKPTYFKGTGLGLSLTRKLVEGQGGRIWATSLGKGRGATFAFTLPKPTEEWIRTFG
jgi:PAS domain S-box-containing protein